MYFAGEIKTGQCMNPIPVGLIIMMIKIILKNESLSLLNNTFCVNQVRRATSRE